MTVYEQFKILLQAQGACEIAPALMEALFLRAESDFMGACNRDCVPKGAEAIIAEIMLIHYNRIGAEGETGRREGDIAYNLDSTLTSGVLGKLRKFNRGRVL